MTWKNIYSYVLNVSNSKESTCNTGDLGSIPGSGRSPGEGHGNSILYSCLENPMDRGAWQATVHGVEKSQTRLSDFTSLYFILAALSFCHCTGFSLVSVSGDYSLLPCSGFSPRWLLLLWRTVIVSHRLSCLAACRIFSDQGQNSRFLSWQANSYPLYHQEVLILVL